MKRYLDTEIPSSSLEENPAGDFVKYEEVCLEIDKWRRVVVRQRDELGQLKAALPDSAKLRLLAAWFDNEQSLGRWNGEAGPGGAVCHR